jgi:hypothetical protein
MVPLMTGSALRPEMAEDRAFSQGYIINPAYTVVVPLPHPIKIPVAYPLFKKDPNFIDFVTIWLDLKKRDGTIGSVFEHWIVGK